MIAKMRTVEQTKNPMQDLIASYQARVDEITTIIDNTSHIMVDSKRKKPMMSFKTNEPIMKNNFNKMMTGILLDQEENEKKAKQYLKNFLKIQKEEACKLREALIGGDIERMKKVQNGIEKEIAEIKTLLNDIYGQQNESTKKLRRFLSRRKDFNKTEKVSNMVTYNESGNLSSFSNSEIPSLFDRATSIEGLLKEIRKKIGIFKKEHSEIRTELNKKLKNFVENLHKECNQTMILDK